MTNANNQKSKQGSRNFLLSIIPYFIFFVSFQFLGAFIANVDITNLQAGQIPSKQFCIITLFSLIGTIIAVWLFKKYIDKETFATVGFTKNDTAKDISLGLLFGFAIMLIGFIILRVTKQISVESTNLNTAELLFTICIFIFVALAEELYFRGYVLNNLMSSFNRITALIISASFFAIVHSINPDFSVWSFIGIFIAGIFLGISYVFTKSLWLPISLHFSWNFFQSFFGFNVSGINAYSFYDLKYNTETIWNGGKFGLESSVLVFLFQAVAIFLLYLIFRKRKIN